MDKTLDWPGRPRWRQRNRLYLLSWLDRGGARVILADDADHDHDEDARRSERLTSLLTVCGGLHKRSSAQR